MKVGILTAGGLAPCLSSSIGALIEEYTKVNPNIEILCYKYGYKGLLLGDSIKVSAEVRKNAKILFEFGGSVIGNSRVKLSNTKDCLKRGLIKEGEDPMKVAADQLVKDGVSILHTIGGDDTNTAAAELAAFLKKNDYRLTVIGLPKTVDNDVVPIKQSLGASTAAEHGARFFANVVAESTANPKMLIVHEVMGRNCGWLTVATALKYREFLSKMTFVSELGVTPKKYDVHGVYIPEMPVDLQTEAARLKRVMDEHGNVNIFISEGAGVESIIKEMEAKGETIQRDAFGHVKLDTINPGKWFGDQFAKMIGAEKTLVQKSGYFSRAAAPNAEDLSQIQTFSKFAIQCALQNKSGVVGNDEESNNALSVIDFNRIKGGKPCDIHQPAFQQLLTEIGQQKG